VLLAASLLGNLALVFVVLRFRRAFALIEAGRAQWSIAVIEAPSPLALHDAAVDARPALTARDVRDVRAEFVADPFLWRRDSRWHLFFEVKEKRRRLGSIAVATSADGRRFQYERVVLREPFHLSYPYVFESGSETFMVPECGATGSVRLYRAKRFPHVWDFEATLLSGAPFADATLFEHGGLWWMFTSEPTHDILRLHHAKNLLGPWVEHPSSPIVRGDPHVSRPAGRVVVMEDGRLLRFAQDDVPAYGKQVYAFGITRLDETGYEESPALDRPVLGPSNFGWNKYKMHHVDAHLLEPGRWLACVDGQGYPFERRRRPAWQSAEEAANYSPKRRPHS
jgi:hypothetical protein